MTNDATASTRAVLDAAEQHYNLADRQDFTDAFKGLIAPLPGGKIVRDDGLVMMDEAWFGFLQGEPARPDTVDASLWRQSQLISRPGLYQVTDRLYQFRNADMANLTIVEGEDGLIVIDCTTAPEVARAGMKLFRETVADKPLAAIIYTHTHVDHYGGVKGVVDEADVLSGKVPIIAPGTISSFDFHALGENVLAGNAMSRRAAYAFGSLLDFSPTQMLTCGVSIGSTRGVSPSYISPTDPITKTGESRQIAGLTFEFLYAPDTEAPEEMHIWIPELGALTCAENANHLLHNIQTLRGARTRDARNFARYLDETLVRWGSEAKVNYGPHTWPVWGNEEVTDFISSQRDTYKFIHDQSLRLANKGWTPLEAAEVVHLPESLDKRWFNHGYHGTLHHDVRAVFTKELGMWDGDPVSLHPHTPVDTATRYVELIGPDKILAEGKRAYDDGDYRWATQVTHNLVFAQPDNTEARELQADAYEQLGYQAEGPQWRGIYLSAAKELREGIAEAPFTTASPDTIAHMPLDLMFDFAAVHVDGDKAADANLALGFEFETPAGPEAWHLWIANGVLNARPGSSDDVAATIKGPKMAAVAALLEPAKAQSLVTEGKLKVEGDAAALGRYADLLDSFDPAFPIVTP